MALKTDAEIAELAFDIAGGRVFTTWHMRQGDDMLSMIFLPLALMDKQAMEDFKAAKPALIYEYLDKAGPRSINGYPCFFSLKFLNEDETRRLQLKLDEVEAFRKKLAGAPGEAPPTEAPKTAG